MLTIHITHKPFYRVRHDAEKGALRTCAPCPEVFPLNDLKTPFGESWQHLSYALNPGMTGDHWRSLYQYNRAFTNGNGFNDPDDPRLDYVNHVDLGSPLPAWDKTRTCGGATLRGVKQGNYLIIEIMDGNGPAPTLEWLLARPWLYFHAVNVTANGITRFPQNDGRPCLVPLVGHGTAQILLSAVQEVPGIADPYAMGYVPSPY